MIAHKIAILTAWLALLLWLYYRRLSLYERYKNYIVKDPRIADEIKSLFTLLDVYSVVLLAAVCLIAVLG